MSVSFSCPPPSSAISLSVGLALEGSKVCAGVYAGYALTGTKIEFVPCRKGPRTRTFKGEEIAMPRYSLLAAAVVASASQVQISCAVTANGAAMTLMSARR